MSTNSNKEFTRLEAIAFATAAAGLVVGSEMIHQWGAFFYHPAEEEGRTIYVAMAAIGTIFFIGMLFDAVTDPLVGMWSDRTGVKPGWLRLVPIIGRRRPFMFWGSIFMTLTGIAFWYPPVLGQSQLNFLYGAVVMCLHWLFFTICMVPMNSLGPELARSREGRVKLGSYYSAGMMLGITFTAILPGMMIEALDPARKAEPSGYSAVGYQHTGIILALLALVLIQVATWTLRERHQPAASSDNKLPAAARYLAVLKNKPFLMWMAVTILFNIGFLALQKALPYWVVVALDGDEGTVPLLMGPFVLAALVALPLMPLASKRIPNKWLWFIAALAITLVMPTMYLIPMLPCSMAIKMGVSIGVFCICGVGQGMLFMLYTPLMGEIIDLDEQRTGVRQEGIYCGISGVAWKSGQALAAYVTTIPMELWGNSVESPTGTLLIGPIASVFGFVALGILWFYPVLKGGREPSVDPE